MNLVKSLTVVIVFPFAKDSGRQVVFESMLRGPMSKQITPAGAIHQTKIGRKDSTINCEVKWALRMQLLRARYSSLRPSPKVLCPKPRRQTRHEREGPVSDRKMIQRFHSISQITNLYRSLHPDSHLAISVFSQVLKRRRKIAETDAERPYEKHMTVRPNAYQSVPAGDLIVAAKAGRSACEHKERMPSEWPKRITSR